MEFADFLYGDLSVTAVFHLHFDSRGNCAEGVLVNNQIDTATGTLKLKAEFPNADNALFPNQFVNVRMVIETRPDVTLVPSAGIQRGAPGTFVYVVKSDQTVSVAPVRLGPTQGEQSAIESGISAGDMVVVDGADRLREGAKVELITPGTGNLPAETAGTERRGARGGKSSGEGGAAQRSPNDGQRRAKSNG